VTDDDLLQAVLAHLDMLYNLARRVTSSREEAEDLVQESCVRALRGWRRARPERMGPWLATICLNTARSQYRWKLARPEVLDAEPGISAPSSDDTAEQALKALDRESIQLAIDELSPEQREAVTLMDLCGFTAAQVAEIVGAPRNTVLARVHRGHKRLAAILEERVKYRDP
jgi:RNA polymerase sigma-70 factor (ECF subfamily)